MPPPRRAAKTLALALLAAACAATGCAAPRPAPPLQPGSTQALLASDVYRPGPRRVAFSTPDGLTVDRAYDPPNPQAPDRWTITTTVQRTGQPPELLQRVTVGTGPDGSAVLHALEQPGRLSTFDPPLALLPAYLAPGQTFTSASTVASRRDPAAEPDTGPAELTATLADPGPNPPGPIRLRTVMTFRLGPATITRTVDQWFDAGNLRQEDEDRRVTVGPFTIESERRELRRSGD